ncbi:MAG: BamA/TamA family outer membrane protein [candidate division WOR-3 bacterium]|nr:BamA/TamA family outer membrane protein [candidate division WOR-3 bacterium]
MPTRFILILIGYTIFSILYAGNDSLPTEPFSVEKIIFQGNISFKPKLLKQLLDIKEKEEIYSLAVEKATRNLISFYVQQGFQYINLETDLKKTTKGITIIFKINEGPRIKISKINIFWVNRLIPIDTLRAEIPYKTADFKKGKFNLSVLHSQLKIRAGDFLIIPKILQSQDALAQWYQDNGYAFVNTDYHIKVDNLKADVSFFIEEGPLVTIKEIRVRGNQNVRYPIILRTAQIKIGEKYSRKKITTAIQRLYGTRLFERVSFSISVIDTSHLPFAHIDSNRQKSFSLVDSITLRFDVLEQPARSIGLGIGLQASPLRLILSTEWEHLNFLSRGQNLFFSFGYAPTFTKDWRTELKSIYRIFYILALPINFSFQPSFKYEKRNISNTDVVNLIEETNLNIETGVSRYFGPNLECGTYLRYLRIWIKPLLPVINQKTITNSQNIYLRYDTRDNLFTPQKGVFFSTNLQLAGSVLSGDNDFYKIQSELVLFKSLLNDYVIGFRIMSGLAVPYGRSSQIPFYDAFTLGGNNGLRGFAERALGPDSIGTEHYGSGMINANWELRSHYQKLLDWVVFSDWGRVDHQGDIIRFDWDKFFYSVGLGIRINTRIGPIRIDYAKRLKSAPTGDWGKIHLGLLNMF